MNREEKRKRLWDILDKPIFPREGIDPLNAVVDHLLDNDVEPVVHARWGEYEDPWGEDTTYRCTNCAEEVVIPDGTPEGARLRYCPGCGARMDGESHGENE